MTRTLITAITFSFVYLVELLVFGIGASQRGWRKRLSYCFLAVVLALWVGFLSIRKREFRYKAGGFITFALALSLWVRAAWRIEIAVEEHEDQETIATLRRIDVFDVTGEPRPTDSHGLNYQP